MTVESFIEKHEGDKLKPYKCPAGFNTIGRGWNFDANPLPKPIADYLKKHGCITQEMSDLLLSLSVKNAISDCLDLFPNWDDISLNRRMALIDFVFQLGKTKALHFHHTIAAINTGRWEDAANHMRQSAWFKQVPKRAQEVTDLIEAG
ncbi:MAG: glycoside hydrolase family protein [Methylobacter sp.]